MPCLSFTLSASVFKTHVRSATGGYVFTGVCLFRGEGVPQPLVPDPFQACGPRSFLGGREEGTQPLVLGPRSFLSGGRSGGERGGRRKGIPLSWSWPG